MPVSTTVKVSCNSCGREPGREMRYVNTSAPQEDDYDRIMYGWIRLHVEHLCTAALGHNSLPIEDIVLCSDCWPRFAFLGTHT